jgi:hypothetical protein
MKCEGIECPIKNDCERFTKKAKDIQAYFTIAPYENGNCKFFISTKQKKS